jgi:DmsE family decaheme c-type cytochrome
MECHGHQPIPRHHLDCESCHGSGQRHVQNVLVATGVRFPANADCLHCHETGHRGLLAWELSEHQRAGVLCSDCHDPHNGEPFHLRPASDPTRNAFPHAGAGTTLCVGCHAEVASELSLPSHHPVREGMVACTDCHAPHEAREIRLGEKTAECAQCHQAQAGPWVFEHTPVVEDCGYCHVPHGASASPLLTATQPGACVYCHTVAEMGATHDPQAFVTRCTDCHGAVHGSYADPHLRR